MHRRIRWRRWPWRSSIIGVPVAARERRRLANAPAVIRSADDDDAIVGGRDRACGLSHSAGANQILALRPVAAAAREHPRRADAPTVVRSTDHHDAAVGGKRDRGCGLSHSAGPNQLLLLPPLTAAPGRPPCPPPTPS